MGERVELHKAADGNYHVIDPGNPGTYAGMIDTSILKAVKDSDGFYAAKNLRLPATGGTIEETLWTANDGRWIVTMTCQYVRDAVTPYIRVEVTPNYAARWHLKFAPAVPPELEALLSPDTLQPLLTTGIPCNGLEPGRILRWGGTEYTIPKKAQLGLLQLLWDVEEVAYTDIQKYLNVRWGDRTFCGNVSRLNNFLNQIQGFPWRLSANSTKRKIRKKHKPQ